MPDSAHVEHKHVAFRASGGPASVLMTMDDDDFNPIFFSVVVVQLVVMIGIGSFPILHLLILFI